jgi:hypothetical protein
MKKHTVEVRIGRDEDDRWWVVVIVDANDNEAVWRGPHTISKPPRKRGSRSPPRLTVLMMKRSGNSSLRGACHQLSTDTRKSFIERARARMPALRDGERVRLISRRGLDWADSHPP